MQRDMSYELDGIFSSRGAGELVTVKQTRTRVTRSPGLAPAARMAGGDVRNLTPAIGRPMHRPHPRNISPALARSLGLPMAKSLALPIFSRPGDLADGDSLAGTVTLPVIGTVSVGMLAVAALAGFAAFRLSR
jgi:hypothetical protein